PPRRGRGGLGGWWGGGGGGRGGLLASFELNRQGGPMIVLVLIALYALSALAGVLRSNAPARA
ncbi:MAG: hypothetical protein ACIARR_01225, partial [Phycisphaerales bacterium JB059]